MVRDYRLHKASGLIEIYTYSIFIYLCFIFQFDVERFRDMYTDLKYLEGKRHHKKEKKTVTPEKVRN